VVILQAFVDFSETKQNRGTALACSQKLELRDIPILQQVTSHFWNAELSRNDCDSLLVRTDSSDNDNLMSSTM
jgi:hypothetical protein